MSAGESILEIKELKARREGHRLYLMLKDGNTWIKAEIAMPIHFAREFYKLAVAADEEQKRLDALKQKGLRHHGICGVKP